MTRQVRGPYGNINQDGSPTGKALLLNNHEPDFLDEVEPGIRPVVAAAVARGLDTFSSCEGHHYPRGIAPYTSTYRMADVVVERHRAEAWLAFGRALAVQHAVNYNPVVKEDAIPAALCNRPYKDPVRVVFSWPITSPELADEMTTWLAEALLAGAHPPAA